MNTLVYPTTYNHSLLPVRVFCTHEPKRRNELHFEDIPSSELSNHEVICDRRCQVCGMPLLLDNRFLVESYLGSGGFSRTWLAVDLSDDPLQEQSIDSKPKRVVKQFFPKTASLRVVEYHDLKRRFAEEAYRLSSLKHPHIPKIIKYFEIDRTEDNVGDQKYYYIVQEYIEGKNLKELNTSFSVNDIISILYQILNVLEYLHGKGVIHRDIKPENIIYSDKENKYYLIDFGAAKNVVPLVEHLDYIPQPEDIQDPLVYVPPQSIDDQRGTRIGTPGFVAPEQWKDRKAVFASDQYSLAATCVYLLTQSDEGFCENSIHSPQWQQSIQDHFETSPELFKILSKMLMPTPAERFQSNSEILMALKKMPSPQTLPAASKVAGIPILSGIRNRLFNPIKRHLLSSYPIYKNLALFSLSGLLGFGIHYLLYPSSRTLNNQKTNHSPASVIPQSVRARTQEKLNNRAAHVIPNSSLGALGTKVEPTKADVKDARSDETLAKSSFDKIPKTSLQNDQPLTLNDILDAEQNKVLKANQQDNQNLTLSDTSKTNLQDNVKAKVNNTPKIRSQNNSKATNTPKINSQDNSKAKVNNTSKTNPQVNSQVSNTPKTNSQGSYKVNNTPKTNPQGGYKPKVNKNLKTTSQNNRKLKLNNVFKTNRDDNRKPKENENLESKMDKILKTNRDGNRKPKWDNTPKTSQRKNREPEVNTNFDLKTYRIKSRIHKILQPDHQNNREPKANTNLELKIQKIKSKIHKIFQSDGQEDH